MTAERILYRLEWQVIRRLDGLLQGNYQTLFYGSGLDFADLRAYHPPDDIRHIDWNVTARMNSPYVRQYMEEREITAWFLLDLSPSMHFGPVSRSKEMVLTDLVATLARLLTRNGNRVGAVLYNNHLLHTVPPRSSRSHVLRLIHELSRIAAPPEGLTTNLAHLLQAGHQTLARRSLVFVISDFFSEPGWERPLALLNRRHELVAIRLWDPRETELPDAGLLVVEDAESNQQLLVDTGDPRFRRRFQEAVERRERTLKETMRRAAVDLFAVSTEQDLVRAIVEMVAFRQNQRRVGQRSKAASR